MRRWKRPDRVLKELYHANQYPWTERIPICAIRRDHGVSDLTCWDVCERLRFPMPDPRVIITGSCGLIGSAACAAFHRRGFRVVGIDSNHRAVFFGPEGDTSWVLQHLQQTIPQYRHEALDIRDREGVERLLAEIKPQLVIHTASQPSHDRAAAIPFLDFEVNAVGTLNLLEAVRRNSPDSIFVHMSTNKVYGDLPNSLSLREEAMRWEYASPDYACGIQESFSIDQSTHSLFGVSKLAADLLVQEYGRYFQIRTCCLRCGCLTGPKHSGVELHGFLSYLIKCNIECREYSVYGYKGKQVRDNLHSDDVVGFMYEFYRNPRIGEVYNLGGGRENSCSILEAFAIAEQVTSQKMLYRYSEQNRIGDHICYYSDLRKIRAHYPEWRITKPLRTTFEEIAQAWRQRLTP